MKSLPLVQLTTVWVCMVCMYLIGCLTTYICNLMLQLCICVCGVCAHVCICICMHVRIDIIFSREMIRAKTCTLADCWNSNCCPWWHCNSVRWRPEQHWHWSNVSSDKWRGLQYSTIHTPSLHRECYRTLWCMVQYTLLYILYVCIHIDRYAAVFCRLLS